MIMRFLVMSSSWVVPLLMVVASAAHAESVDGRAPDPFVTNWLNFELGANYFTTADSNYAFGFTAAYSPKLKKIIPSLPAFDLVPRLELHLTKNYDRGVFPVGELGLEGSYTIDENYYFGPGVGLSTFF